MITVRVFYFHTTSLFVRGSINVGTEVKVSSRVGGVMTMFSPNKELWGPLGLIQPSWYLSLIEAIVDTQSIIQLLEATHETNSHPLINLITDCKYLLASFTAGRIRHCGYHEESKCMILKTCSNV